MKFLEKDLEEIIYTSGRDVLEERGLSIEGKLLRQVKIGNYGIADLISIRKPRLVKGKYGFPLSIEPGEITIYELKKDQVGISAFLQSIRYLRGIKTYLEKRGKEHLFSISIVLIGDKIDTQGSFCFIPDLLLTNTEDMGIISFYTYKYCVDGIRFTEQSGYDLRDKGF